MGNFNEQLNNTEPNLMLPIVLISFLFIRILTEYIFKKHMKKQVEENNALPSKMEGNPVFIIAYYYGEYHVGVTKVYTTYITATSEDDARQYFKQIYQEATIKYIQ